MDSFDETYLHTTEKVNAIAGVSTPHLTHLQVPEVSHPSRTPAALLHIGITEHTCSSGSGGQFHLIVVRFGSATKASLTAVFYSLGLLTDADTSSSAETQDDVTYACSNGSDDMGQLGMFCLPISPHEDRVSDASAMIF